MFFSFRYALKTIQICIENHFGSKEKIIIDNEIKLLQKIDHPHVFKYFGTFMHTSEIQCILIEFCEVFEFNLILFKNTAFLFRDHPVSRRS